MSSDSTEKASVKEQSLVFLFCFFVSLIAYGPILGNGLASDDFEVVLRVSKGDLISLHSFFRPLSDISIYLCFLISGINGWSYVLFNLLVHVFCGVLLYNTCLYLFSNAEKKRTVGITAVLLFVLYPFHHESIVWAVGRGSGMATLLAIAALNLALIKPPKTVWILVSGALFFLSLSTYENTVLLPLIAGVLIWLKHRDTGGWWYKWMIVFSLVAIGNLLVRFWLVQLIVGDYGSRIFEFHPLTLVLKFLKASGRLVLPPLHSEIYMMGGSVLAGSLFVFLSFRMFRKNPSGKVAYIAIGAAFLFSFLLPVLFGVSTRTIEGDRLLYFPSFFFSLWLAYILVTGTSFRQLRITVAIIVIYFTGCLYSGNLKWREADTIRTKLLAQTASFLKDKKTAYLVNLPEEYKGAHVFRNGFSAALTLIGIDTTGVEILSFQGESYRLPLAASIIPERDKQGALQIGEHLKFLDRTTVLVWDREKLMYRQQVIDPERPVLFWNNHELELLPLLSEK